MKKMMTAIAACAVASLSLAAGGVTSQNVVGYAGATLKTGYNIISFNWTKVGSPSEGINIQNLFDSTNGLTSGVDAGVADVIMFYSGGFQSVFLFNTGGDPEWAELTGLNDKWLESDYSVSTRTITNGMAFFYRNRGSQIVKSFSGQVPTTTSTTRHVSSGYNMFGSAYTAELDPNDGYAWETAGAVSGVDAGVADMIMFCDGGVFQSIFLFNTGGDPEWSELTGLNGKWLESDYSVTTRKIKLAQGVYYRHRGSGFDWQQTKPYSL